jgi:hypothetical protein
VGYTGQRLVAPLNLGQKWSRLTRMSAEEVITRVQQEASKRVDLALFRLGRNGRPHPRLANASKSIFFFDADEIPARVSLLRKYLPLEVETAIQDADEILRHRFNLLGYKGLDYGREIDWHLDAVHQKRAPFKPWFHVNFLDFSEVGDHKITWELNRHQHLVTLAKAWCFTSDKAYADEVIMQWYHWQIANPYPLGINWASALEVAFRSLSWIWIKNLLAGFREVPANFHADLLAALRQNGRYIERYHSKYFSPNTHLLGEAVALLYIGTLCPELPEADRWRKWGWKVIVDESARQVRPDGVYFEQSLYYHVYALDLFLYARALAARNGVVIPEKLDNVLVRMLDFLFAVSEGGAAEGFGDDDGGRLFNARRNRVEHMTDPLVFGAAEYQRPDWGAAAGLTEEAIWLFGETAVHASAGERPKLVADTRAFESGGVYLIRDTDPFPQQLMIDAGPMGAETCGHGHADALGIRLSLDGRRCLIDPGTYCYISAGDERSRFRATAAHNTMRIDGEDQSIPNGPFAWDSVTHSRTRQWLSGETFNLFEGEHDGYCSLPDPVLHRRMVFHAKGGFWLVRDIVEGGQAHLLEIFWHFNPEFRVEAQRGQITASLITSETNGHRPSSRIHLLLSQPSVWQTEVQAGEASPVYGLKVEAPVARVHATVPLAVESAVLLVPLVFESQPGQFDEARDEKAPQDVRVYRYLAGSLTWLIFFSEVEGGWSWGPWSSDARVFCCRIEEGRVKQMALIAGHFAKWQEKLLVSSQQHIEVFEWTYSNGVIRTFPATATALEYAKDATLTELEPAG